MPKAPFLEIKVRPSEEEKDLFKRASDAYRPPLSLNQWLLVAGLELAEKQGFKLGPKPKGGKKP